eukprot:GHVQ01013593.1.p1 GENE.GHVQ01013593.1~~GHVQ01013593.1.p1  ORF type:complete len:530 (+),score=61.06 GHVQ01013593.1:394-1983(+)
MSTLFKTMSRGGQEQRSSSGSTNGGHNNTERTSSSSSSCGSVVNSRNSPDIESEKTFAKKLAAFKVRTLWTCILVALFFVILGGGHLYCSLLVLVVIMGIYREIISLKRKREKDKKLPLFFVLRWYWFGVVLLWQGIPWVLPKLIEVTTYVSYLHTIQAYHSLMTYSAALLGFVLFILSLRRYTLRYQFGQLGIMFLTLIIVVAQSLIQVANIYRGLIWFFLPTSLVVVNDVFAYVFGMLFGRTRLIKLSPKKTVEGYIGASVMTLGWAVFLTWCLQRYKVFTCPQRHIVFRPFDMWYEMDCPSNPIYEFTDYNIPCWLTYIVGRDSLTATPMQFHALVLGVFAAFVAPFGGFFASGFKRAVRIKDFGDSIPGHGGITDRFDCQILMGMFTYVYLKTLLSPKAGTSSLLPSSVDEIMQAIQLLSLRDQLDLVSMVQRLVHSKVQDTSTHHRVPPCLEFFSSSSSQSSDNDTCSSCPSLYEGPPYSIFGDTTLRSDLCCTEGGDRIALTSNHILLSESNSSSFQTPPDCR